MDISIDNNQVRKLLIRLEAVSSKEGGAQHKAIQNIARIMRGALVRNVSNKILHVRTGRLRSSIEERVVKSAAGYGAVIGSGVLTGKRVKYADIHETGGVIRQGARSELFTRKRRKRTTKYGKKGQFFRGTSSGQGFTFRERVIRIPARRYISKTARQNMHRVTAVLKKHIDAALKK